MQDNLILFCDASYDPATKAGFAGVLMGTSEFFETTSNLEAEVQLKSFQNTSCSKLEVQGVIWALNRLKEENISTKIQVFTDSQTVAGLPERREKLEENHFQSKKTGQDLNHAEVYREFFAIYDQLHPTITWIKGHTQKSQKVAADHLFSIVDRTVRQKLRATIKNKPSD